MPNLSTQRHFQSGKLLILFLKWSQWFALLTNLSIGFGIGLAKKEEIFYEKNYYNDLD